MFLDGLNWRWGVEIREVKDDTHVPGFRTFRTNLLKMFEKKQSYEIKGQQLIEGLEIWKERWELNTMGWGAWLAQSLERATLDLGL